MAGREPLDPIPNSNVKSPSAYDTVAISHGKVGRRQAFSYTTSHSPKKKSLPTHTTILIAGWSSPVARQAHNLKVAGSNPAPATIKYTNPFLIPFDIYVNLCYNYRYIQSAD